MSDNIKILKNYLLYFGTLIITCIICASNVLAYTYEDVGYLSSNATVQVEVDYNAQPLTLAKDREFYLTEVRQLNVFVSNVSMQANTTYQIELQLPNQKLTHANAFEVINYTQSGNETCTNMEGTTYAGEYPKFYFKCNSNITSFYLRIYNSSNNYITDEGQFRWNYVYARKRLGDNNQNQEIIDNQNQNTQDIINNNNENTNKIIEENKKNFETCGSNLLDGIDYIKGNITATGEYQSGSARVLSDYFKIKKVQYNYNISDYLIFYIIEYDYQRSFISRTQINNSSGTFTPGNNTEYLRISFRKSDNTDLTPQDIKNSSPTFYSENDCTNKLDEQKNAINNLDNTLKDDNTSDAENEASNFFESFTTDTFGLTSIITAPLTLIQSVLSSTCTTLQLPLPYLENKNLELPCMTSIYTQYFGTFFTIYQTITYGIIAYWVCVRIFNQVKDFKNPEHDEIEVMDL